MKEVAALCMRDGCGVLASHKSPDGPWLWCYDHKGRDDKPLVTIIPPSPHREPVDPARQQFERRLESLRQQFDERSPHLPVAPSLLAVAAEYRRRRIAETQK